MLAFQKREREAREALERKQAEDDNATEMANNIYGDFLTENPAVAQSAFGPHRVVPDRWKGMSPEQLADIRRMQDIQRREMEVRSTKNYKKFGSVFCPVCCSQKE